MLNFKAFINSTVITKNCADVALFLYFLAVFNIFMLDFCSTTAPLSLCTGRLTSSAAAAKDDDDVVAMACTGQRDMLQRRVQ